MLQPTDLFWQPVRTSFDKSLRISLSPAGTEMVLVRGLLGSDGGREAWRAWQYIENQAFSIKRLSRAKRKGECWPTRLVLLVSRPSLDVDVGPWSSLRQVARSVASREDGWVVPGPGTCNQNQLTTCIYNGDDQGERRLTNKLCWRERPLAVLRCPILDP